MQWSKPLSNMGRRSRGQAINNPVFLTDARGVSKISERDVTSPFLVKKRTASCLYRLSTAADDQGTSSFWGEAVCLSVCLSYQQRRAKPTESKAQQDAVS